MLYLACVANGRIISYSQDGTIKLIEAKYLITILNVYLIVEFNIFQMDLFVKDCLINIFMILLIWILKHN